MSWPAEPEVDSNERVGVPPNPVYLTNIAPSSTDDALLDVAKRVEGETRMASCEAVAEWAAKERYAFRIPRLERLYLVAHGSAGHLNMRASSSDGTAVSLVVGTYRPLLRCVTDSVLAPDAQIWLLGCHVGCRNPYVRDGDGPLLLLSIARWTERTVVAPTRAVYSSWFGPAGPDEDVMKPVYVGPRDCPPIDVVPAEADLAEDTLALGEPSLATLLASITGARAMDLGASLLFEKADTWVDGGRPYDGSLLLDLPTLSFPVGFADGTAGAVEVTLDGLAVGVRRDVGIRLLYPKRRGVSNLLSLMRRGGSGV